MIRENKMNYNQWRDLILSDLNDDEKEIVLERYNLYATSNEHKGKYVYAYKNAYTTRNGDTCNYSIPISLQDDNPELEAYKTIGWYAKIRSNNTIAHFEDIFVEFSQLYVTAQYYHQ